MIRHLGGAQSRAAAPLVERSQYTTYGLGIWVPPWGSVLGNWEKVPGQTQDTVEGHSLSYGVALEELGEVVGRR